jgi:NADH:ubiquinone oxidoreductase subunit D
MRQLHEVLYYLASDGSDIPQRVKIRTPTFVNMPSVQAMSVGGEAGSKTDLLPGMVSSLHLFLPGLYSVDPNLRRVASLCRPPTHR